MVFQAGTTFSQRSSNYLLCCILFIVSATKSSAIKSFVVVRHSNKASRLRSFMSSFSVKHKLTLHVSFVWHYNVWDMCTKRWLSKYYFNFHRILTCSQPSGQEVFYTSTVYITHMCYCAFCWEVFLWFLLWKGAFEKSPCSSKIHYFVLKMTPD